MRLVVYGGFMVVYEYGSITIYHSPRILEQLIKVDTNHDTDIMLMPTIGCLVV